MRASRVRVYAVDYQERGRSGPSTCHVVAGSSREARAIAAVTHPAARILEAREAPAWAGML